MKEGTWIAVGIAFVLVVLYYTAKEWKSCNLRGGVLVRGAFWYECVRNHEYGEK